MMLKLALFALTGMGNTVLRALCHAGHVPVLLVTRREEGPFPYYQERPVADEAAALGIPCLFGAEGENRFAEVGADVLMAATYHRIIPPHLLARARYGLNVHPSLLPRYRGPNPFFWVIKQGENTTGVTVHRLSEEVDGGEIYWQEATPLLAHETQGLLRQRLAHLAGRGAVAVMETIREGRLQGWPQDPTAASAFPRPKAVGLEEILALNATLESVRHHILALLPYPGVVIHHPELVAALRHCAGSDRSAWRSGEEPFYPLCTREDVDRLMPLLKTGAPTGRQRGER